MTWLQFFADVIKSLTSLAWPVAIVIIVWMFRSRLTELLPFLDLSYKDFRLSLRKTEKKSEALPEPEGAKAPPEDDEFEKLLKVSPVAALTHVRQKLDGSLIAYAERRGLSRIPIGLHRL